MKPAWDKLSAEYADSTSVVVADADCTGDGKPLCDKNGVSGYPTIKYFDGEGAHDYSGGRDFDSLKKFVDETLVAKCLIEDQSECSEKEQKYIAKYQPICEDKAVCATNLEKLKKKAKNPMSKKNRVWMAQRIQILSQLA